MPLSSVLNFKEEAQLDQWLNTKKLVLNNRTRREISDVVTIARLVKKLDNQLVNLDNYVSHCSLDLKLENWETFNFKVLRRMGLILSPSELEDLALGKLNALKALFYRLMCIERDGYIHPNGIKLPRRAILDPTSADTRKPFESLNTEHPQNVCDLNVPHCKQVPYAKYQLLMDENSKKEKYINSINHKVQYLESLLLVKEERINGLLEDLDTLSSRIAFKSN